MAVLLDCMKIVLLFIWTSSNSYKSRDFATNATTQEEAITGTRNLNPGVGGGGGTPRNFWLGCAARFPNPLPNFRPKYSIFPHPFSDLDSKIHTRFQTFVVS